MQRHPFQIRFATAAVAAAAITVSLTAGTINVPGDAPTIQIAVNLASSGDEIVVAPGTYFEAINLNGKTLTIRSMAGPEATIIDAFGQFTPVVRMISGEGPETLLEGFTLRNGQATGAPPAERGGGLYCNNTSPTIRECVFIDNLATIGGAFYANVGSPRFFDCRFESNEATSAGGVAYLNSTTADFIGCDFINNTAGSIGGAIRHVSTNGEYIFCRFEGNHAELNGGALDMAGTGASNMFYRDCEFVGNTAGNVGGAVQLATPVASIINWVNCVFRNNSATDNGGAVHVLGRGEFVNCTYHGNSSGGAGGGGAMYTAGGAITSARNCIAWGNSPNGFNITTGASYCNIQNVLVGPGNISVDPQFVDAAGGDLRLQETSPSIDAGASANVPVWLTDDLDGLPRVVNGLASGATGVPVFGYYVDMGAYEFQPEGGPPATCPADLNGDDLINVLDLLQVLSAWGTCP